MIERVNKKEQLNKNLFFIAIIIILMKLVVAKTHSNYKIHQTIPLQQQQSKIDLNVFLND